jgi:hypothetical protein
MLQVAAFLSQVAPVADAVVAPVLPQEALSVAEAWVAVVLEAEQADLLPDLAQFSPAKADRLRHRARARAIVITFLMVQLLIERDRFTVRVICILLLFAGSVKVFMEYIGRLLIISLPQSVA